MSDDVRLTDDDFKIVDDTIEWRRYGFNKCLKHLCRYDGFGISIDKMSDKAYEGLKEFYYDVSDEMFEGCIVNKQELLSILHRYEYLHMEPLLEENMIRKALDEDVWGGIMALFTHMDSSINDVLVKLNKRNGHPLSEYFELVEAHIITYEELKYLALLADHMSEGKIHISPEKPSGELIEKWFSISSKIHGALTITGSR